MWYNETVFYQIYPLGFCDAPKNNDFKVEDRIKKVIDWIPHFKKMNVGAILFNPIFNSSSHGYDTIDYYYLDERLGRNEDFVQVVEKLHNENIKVVVDGVFNHVGRDFWAFKDVKEHKWDSRYKDWFLINFDGDSNYHDGFYYEGWEGHFELVKLNLENSEVINYLMDSIKHWINDFKIDGIRLDVAYSLNDNFLKTIRSFTTNLKADFFLVGEVIHGDYSRVMSPDKLQSVTNYQAYKGMWSSFNSYNFFEIAHTFNEHFLRLYPNDFELLFVDNHDVTRCASILTNPNHLKLIYALLITSKGIPCIYYGSEWGAKGDKRDGDDGLRLSYPQAEENELSEYIANLNSIRNKSKTLQYGNYKQVTLTNNQFIFARSFENETIYVAINMNEKDFFAKNSLNGEYLDLLTNTVIDCANGINLERYRAYVLIANDSVVTIKAETNKLELARKNINKIDEEMAKLFCDRMKQVEEVIDYKIANGLEVLDQSRELQVIENNLKYLKDDKYREYYRDYIKSVMFISKQYQKNILNRK